MQYIYYSRYLISKARPEDISTSPYTHFKPKVYIGVRIILRQILTKKTLLAAKILCGRREKSHKLYS